MNPPESQSRIVSTRLVSALLKVHSRYRSPKLGKMVAHNIEGLAPPQKAKFCHVCGTHEWTITHHGLRALLPETIEVIAGPGCPVCVLPAADIDQAISLALNGITVATYGDVIRVPATQTSLQEAKASGGDVRIAYSLSDVVKMARKEQKRDFVFLAIGFETTAPSTAVEILNKPPKNLSFLVSHRLIPPAMELLLKIDGLQIDGFIAPGHVSTIIGTRAYEAFPDLHQMPTVVAGFEPLDVLVAVSLLLKQLREERAALENEYTRCVTWQGNTKAQQLMNQVFKVVDGWWRGLGTIPSSALVLREEFEAFDARTKYDLKIRDSSDSVPGCLCHLVIVGKISPPECPLFRKACTPQSPKGACMVSNEGTCRIWAVHNEGN